MDRRLAGGVFSHHPLCRQPAAPGSRFLQPDLCRATHVLWPRTGWLPLAAKRQARAHPGHSVLFLSCQSRCVGGSAKFCDGEEVRAVGTSEIGALSPRNWRSEVRYQTSEGGGAISRGKHGAKSKIKLKDLENSEI